MAEERLKSLGFKLVTDTVRTTFTPTSEVLTQCEELGRAVAEEVLQKG